MIDILFLFRNEEVTKCYQYKTCNQSENTILWTSDAKVYMQQAALKPAGNLVCGETLIGNLSLSVSILPHSEEKLQENLEFDDKLSKCNEHQKICSGFDSFQNHDKTKNQEKPYQEEKCGKSSELSERTHSGEKTVVGQKSVKASTTPSGFEFHERIYTEKKICK